ncbi:DNA repair protein rad26 [Verticillium dahliae]
MDNYSDDGFDDLNPNALQELENNAIQFTQAQTQAPPRTLQPADNPYDDLEFEDDDLDDTELIDGLLPQAPIGTSTNTGPRSYHQKPPLPVPNRPPAPIPPSSRWDTSARSRYAVPNTAHGQPLASQVPLPIGASYRPQHSQFARPAPPTVRPAYQQPLASQAPRESGNDVVAAMQQRLKALESELYSARGEVAIIRANSSKAQQEYTAEVARLKRQNAEQEAKQQRLVEQAVAAQHNATTELQFLQRDVKETSARARRANAAPGVQRNDSGGSATNTPKKASKTWGMADGFDEMDIVLSPSKGRGKSRDTGPVAIPLTERTPTKNKRKRPVVDSPVMALETHEGDLVQSNIDAGATVPKFLAVSSVNTLPFDFLQLVLDHGSLHGEPPTFDILSRYAFPSGPDTSFAAQIYQSLPRMGNAHDPLQLLIDFSHLILTMWHQCLDEAYYRPIWDLVSLLAFTLQLQTVSVAPNLIHSLVPAAERSMYMVLELRYKSTDGDLSGDPAADSLQQQIDTTHILSLLHLAAMASVSAIVQTEEGAQTQQANFWSMMPVDFVLIFLTPNQRLDDILGMMDLLCTSVLSASVGPLEMGKGPETVAYMIIEKLTCNLLDLPRAASTPRLIHTVGSGVLRTLTAFTQSQFGALQVANHDNAIPRLVTTLSGLVDELYDASDPVVTDSPAGSGGNRAAAHPPAGDLGADKADDADDADDDLVGLHRLIKQIVLLLHRLVADPATADAANIQSKLAMAYGGPQRYILSLSRIHFAEEDLVYEAGIDEETAELARELCEFVVTPDEGEGVREAFGV